MESNKVLDVNKIERYKTLVHYIIGLGLAKNQKEVGAMLGYTNRSAFSQVVNGIVRPPKELDGKFLQILPNLSLRWLETGEGDMLDGHVKEETVMHNKISAGGDILNHSNSTAVLTKAVNELGEMRRLLQQQIENNQAQFDRFMALLEKRDEQKQ